MSHRRVVRRSFLRLIPAIALLFPMASLNSTPGVAAEPTAFDSPAAIAFCGGHMWIANQANNSLTELQSSNGRLIQIIESHINWISSPQSLDCIGLGLWVSNSYINSLSEFNAVTGHLSRIVKSPKYELSRPTVLASDAAHLWVINSGSDSITEIDPHSGNLIRVIQLRSGHSSASDYFGPVDLTVEANTLLITNITSKEDTLIEVSVGSGSISGTKKLGPSTPNSNFGYVVATNSHAWISNADGRSLSEVSLNRLPTIQLIHGTIHQFNGIEGLSLLGPDVWISNIYGQSVAELSTKTNTVLRVVQLKAGKLDNPGPIAFDHKDVWVLNTLGSVIVINSNTAKVIRVIV